MPARRFSHILTRQWVIFTLVLSGLFVALGLLLLFVLEDRFIDTRLREVAASVVHADPPPSLPLQFTVLLEEAIPVDLQAPIGALKPGRIREFRAADGRYLHVLHAQDAAQRSYRLIYDVSDELTVNAGLAKLGPFLAASLLLLIGVAWLLAARFVRRAAQSAEGTLELIRQAADPASLRARAQIEPVLEMADLGRLMADAWEQKLESVQRERETLAFLAHELRTPLQSARTSVALLHEGQQSAALLDRLQRAVDRLTRASNAVLWLSSDASSAAQSTAVAPLVSQLVEEFQILAIPRDRQLQLQAIDAPLWSGPSEVLETVLANLLLNAVQHGGSGPIEVRVETDRVSVSNAPGETGEGGFGLGLRIVERLCSRCGWRLERLGLTDRIGFSIVASAQEDPT